MLVGGTVIAVVLSGIRGRVVQLGTRGNGDAGRTVVGT